MTRPFLSFLGLAVASVVLAASTSGCGRFSSSPPSPDALPAGANAVVDHVVDGDTIRIRGPGGGSERVRLIGIDTPETKDPRRPVQCFGREAAAYTTRLLPAATPVRLVRDAEPRDRYGRVLAYVYRARDGLFVNLALADGGYARPLTIPPNVAHATEFVAAAAAARTAGRGLWQACATAARDP